jgi:adenylate cyclase
MDMPDYLYSHVILAAICGQMGRDDEGRQAVARLLELAPDFGTDAHERLAERFQEPALLDQVLDGLRKAGLDISGPAAVN